MYRLAKCFGEPSKISITVTWVEELMGQKIYGNKYKYTFKKAKKKQSGGKLLLRANPLNF
jgi:hypothetical protein